MAPDDIARAIAAGVAQGVQQAVDLARGQSRHGICDMHQDLVSLGTEQGDMLENLTHTQRAQTDKLAAIGADIGVAVKQATDARQVVGLHIAEHDGMDKAKGEITGEHDRKHGRISNTIGWVIGGVGLLFTVLAAVWFLSSQIAQQPPQIDVKALAAAVVAAQKGQP
jgi:hypothetical protein